MTDDRKQVATRVLPLFVFFCLLSLVMGHWFARSAAAQININTVDVATNITMVWEAESYVPPFYKGKALMPDGGNARIVAFLPPGISQTADTKYTWRVDGTVDGDNSGLGRSTYELQSPIFGGSPLIIVEVSENGNIIGTGALRIPLSNPQVLVYLDAPLGGVMFNVESSARRTPLRGEELALETYPLFFTTATRSDFDVSYKWMVDRFTVQNPLGNSGRLVVRSEESIGTTTISVSVVNKPHILENATGGVSLFLE